MVGPNPTLNKLCSASSQLDPNILYIHNYHIGQNMCTLSLISNPMSLDIKEYYQINVIQVGQLCFMLQRKDILTQ